MMTSWEKDYTKDRSMVEGKVVLVDGKRLKKFREDDVDYTIVGSIGDKLIVRTRRVYGREC